jgi:hypothetical protein
MLVKQDPAHQLQPLLMAVEADLLLRLLAVAEAIFVLTSH